MYTYVVSAADWYPRQWYQFCNSLIFLKLFVDIKAMQSLNKTSEVKCNLWRCWGRIPPKRNRFDKRKHEGIFLKMRWVLVSPGLDLERSPGSWERWCGDWKQAMKARGDWDTWPNFFVREKDGDRDLYRWMVCSKEEMRRMLSAAGFWVDIQHHFESHYIRVEK